jgi:hypothetical protein
VINNLDIIIRIKAQIANIYLTRKLLWSLRIKKERRVESISTNYLPPSFYGVILVGNLNKLMLFKLTFYGCLYVDIIVLIFRVSRAIVGIVFR